MGRLRFGRGEIIIRPSCPSLFSPPFPHLLVPSNFLPHSTQCHYPQPFYPKNARKNGSKNNAFFPLEKRPFFCLHLARNILQAGEPSFSPSPLCYPQSDLTQFDNPPPPLPVHCIRSAQLTLWVGTGT